MAKKTKKSKESDNTYLLKLVLYVFMGSFWVRVSGFDLIQALPLGLIIGIVFASHEHFQIDKKIEFAVLLIVSILSYFLPIGLTI